MCNRKNKITSNLVKHSVVMSRKNLRSSLKLMTEAGLSHSVIDRILFQPHKTRSTD